MIDLDDNRLEVAERFVTTTTINGSDDKTQDEVMKTSGKRGIDPATIPMLFKTAGPRKIGPKVPVALRSRLDHILDADETS
jgi:threonine dehydrogenase-like Zn-dependent dehydrogenase